MKVIINSLVAVFFILASSASMAANTAMDVNWICTTNASSSDVEADKAADDKMAKTASSALDAFTFASTNCRDCTKITCEVQEPSTDANSNGNQ